MDPVRHLSLQTVAAALLLLSALSLLGGCQPVPPSPNAASVRTLEGAPAGYAIYVVHDPVRRVTCWLASASNGAGFSCLPDAQVGTSRSSP